MKVLNSMTIKVNSKETNVEILDGKLLIDTKKGKLQVSSVNKNNSTLSFKSECGKDINIPFDGCCSTLLALLNTTKSEKKRELVIFDDYSEYFKNQKEFGACFLVKNYDAAYRYL